MASSKELTRHREIVRRIAHLKLHLNEISSQHEKIEEETLTLQREIGNLTDERLSMECGDLLFEDPALMLRVE